MELGSRIKKLRMENGMSQEALADRAYVSRQTISNWENDKSYPDIESILLLSEIFHISMDDMIRGDVEIMKEKIKTEDIGLLKKYSRIYAGLLIAMVAVSVPLFLIIDRWALIPFGILFALAMVYAFKVEKVKKENDVHTYREIAAFMEGKKLDEIQKQREIGKRPYQKVLLVIGCAIGAFVFCILPGLLIHAIGG